MLSNEHGGAEASERVSTRLKRLIHRTDRVLTVLHPPTAACARVMEAAGCEVGFVGTGGGGGGYNRPPRVRAPPQLPMLTNAGWGAAAGEISHHHGWGHRGWGPHGG